MKTSLKAIEVTMSWISLKKEKPKDKEFVMIIAPKRGGYVVSVGRYTAKEDMFWIGRTKECFATHFQRFPDPVENEDKK